MMSERLGRWHFWLMLVGFNLTFFPMHIAGLLGMPRRIYTYSADRGWTIWNQLSTVGAVLLARELLVLLLELVVSLRRGEPSGDDPWDAWTLEWATTSPPAHYNFEEVPVVRSRRPLWDLKHPEDPDWEHDRTPPDEQHQQLSRRDSSSCAHDRRFPVLELNEEHRIQAGMLCFICSEVAFFGTLIVAYITYWDRTPSGPRRPRAAGPW